MLDHQAEKELHSQQEAQMITFREEHLMRRMLFRFGRATGALPPELVESSDEDELAHRYPNDEDSDSDSDSDINSEPQSDVKLIIRTGEGLHAFLRGWKYTCVRQRFKTMYFEPNIQAGDAGENKEEDDDGKASKGGA